MVNAPSENDFVALDFNGSDSPIRGRVTEVDAVCAEVPETSLMFRVRDEKGSRDVMYAEGEDSDGDYWSTVTNPQTATVLGDGAKWRVLE